jgi:LytS/YehU family sensor histidine kinase
MSTNSDDQRNQLLVSQIQPHFIFNTLSTIQALCRIDPEKAFDTIEKFGSYLRMNLESLGEPTLIPFQKELEHTRIYAEIEMLRYPEIHIVYDIRDDDFELPALSVQPMVENAIRHGVRGKYGGEVVIASREEGGDHIVTIRDNGRGFDPEAFAEDGERSHIGIRNVRERIESMYQGTMRIESEPWKGTTVTMTIPGGREEA